MAKSTLDYFWFLAKLAKKQSSNIALSKDMTERNKNTGEDFGSAENLTLGQKMVRKNKVY